MIFLMISWTTFEVIEALVNSLKYRIPYDLEV